MIRAGRFAQRTSWVLVIMVLCFSLAHVSALNNTLNQPIEDNPLQLLAASCATFCTTEHYSGLDLWLSLEQTCMSDYSVPGNPLRYAVAHMRPQLNGIVQVGDGVVHLPVMWSTLATAFACAFAGTLGLVLGFRSGSSLGGASKYPYPVA